MSVYVSVDLQQQIRYRFADSCAYCLTAEALTATTLKAAFELENHK